MKSEDIWIYVTKCSECGTSTIEKFKKDSIWVNSQGYRVKILDCGTEEVWLYYIANGNKTSWQKEKFVKNYKLEEK